MSQSGGSLYNPKFGFTLPDNIWSAVDFPIPLVPTKPSTWPGLGIGSLWSLNEFYPYWCVNSVLRSLGKLIISMALNGHFFTHRAHPIHRAICILN